MEIRQELSWFSEQMEMTLKENDHKGGWGSEQCSLDYLIERLKEEVNELIVATDSGKAGVENVIRECADVANFAMMIADRFAKGHLSTE
jgi:NTP pyrophosphatase (non-canonical NTP hydrolase)